MFETKYPGIPTLNPREPKSVRPMVMSIGVVNGRSTLLLSVDGKFARIEISHLSFARLASYGVRVDNIDQRG
jgi:hypothetical protein